MRKTFQAIVSVIAGESLLRMANLFVAVVIAREYDSAVLGIYAAGLAFASVVVSLAENGMQYSAITEITRNLANLNLMVGDLFAAKSLIFAFAIAGLVAWNLVHTTTGLAFSMIAFLCVRVFLQSYCQLELSVLKALGRAYRIGFIQAVHFFVLTAYTAFVFWQHLGVIWLLAGMVGAQFLEFSLSAICILSEGVRPQLSGVRNWFGILIRSFPVGFSSTLANLLTRVDVLVLTALVASSAVGRFAAAQMVLVMVYVISWLYGSVLLAELAALSVTVDAAESYRARWTRIILLIGIPLTVVTVAIVPKVLPRIFGIGFLESSRLAMIMIVATPLILLNSLEFNFCLAMGRSRLCMTNYLAALFFAIIVDFTMFSLFGTNGVAAAIVIREALIYLMFRTGSSLWKEKALERA